MSAAKFDQVGKLGDWMTRFGTGPPAAVLASNRAVSASRSAFRRLPTGFSTKQPWASSSMMVSMADSPLVAVPPEEHHERAERDQPEADHRPRGPRASHERERRRLRELAVERRALGGEPAVPPLLPGERREEDEEHEKCAPPP